MQKDSSLSTSSVTSRTSVAVTTQSVPATFSVVSATLKDIQSLPPSAVFTARSGQSSVSMRRSGDTIIAEAACDSIARLLEVYSQEMEATTNELRSQELRYDSLLYEHHSTVVARTEKRVKWWRWFLAGVITGGILVFVVYNRKKIFKLIKTIAYV